MSNVTNEGLLFLSWSCIQRLRIFVVTIRSKISLFLVLLGLLQQTYPIAIMDPSSTAISEAPSNASSKIIVCGLNPALQKRLTLQSEKSLVEGNVHRIESMSEGVGGKGQDVAVALVKSCGLLPCHLKLLQFVGSTDDSTSTRFLELLADKLNAQSVDENNNGGPVCTIRSDGKLRTCTTILSRNGLEATELVEPSCEVNEESFKRLMKCQEDSSHVGAICVMGSMPPGCPTDAYARLIRSTLEKNPNALCLIDSLVGLEQIFEVLQSHSSSTDKSVLKINLAELRNLIISKGNQRASEMIANINIENDISLISAEEVETLSKAFVYAFGGMSRIGVGNLLLTNGRYPANIVNLQAIDNDKKSIHCKSISIDVPELCGKNKALFPIGAGDAVAAGTLLAWHYLDNSRTKENSEKKLNLSILDFDTCLMHALDKTSTSTHPLQRAFEFGLACGSASCLIAENSEFLKDDVLSFLR